MFGYQSSGYEEQIKPQYLSQLTIKKFLLRKQQELFYDIK